MTPFSWPQLNGKQNLAPQNKCVHTTHIYSHTHTHTNVYLWVILSIKHHKILFTFTLDY